MSFNVKLLVVFCTLKRAQAGSDGVVAPGLHADVVGRVRVDQVDLGAGKQPIDVLMAMVGWADKWRAGKAGPPVLYRHHACGATSHVDPRCSHCGDPMHATDIDVLPGPGAAP